EQFEACICKRGKHNQNHHDCAKTQSQAMPDFQIFHEDKMKVKGCSEYVSDMPQRNVSRMKITTNPINMGEKLVKEPPVLSLIRDNSFCSLIRITRPRFKAGIIYDDACPRCFHIHVSTRCSRFC